MSVADIAAPGLGDAKGFLRGRKKMKKCRSAKNQITLNVAQEMPKHMKKSRTRGFGFGKTTTHGVPKPSVRLWMFCGPSRSSMLPKRGPSFEENAETFTSESTEEWRVF